MACVGQCRELSFRIQSRREKEQQQATAARPLGERSLCSTPSSCQVPLYSCTLNNQPVSSVLARPPFTTTIANITFCTLYLSPHLPRPHISPARTHTPVLTYAVLAFFTKGIRSIPLSSSSSITVCSCSTRVLPRFSWTGEIHNQDALGCFQEQGRQILFSSLTAR